MRTQDTHPLTLWLEATGKSASDLARDLGCPRSYISHVIKGRRRPEGLLKRIAERTGIPYDRLRKVAA